MGRKGIAYETVAEAANKLTAAGTPVTNAALLKAVGSGSMSTINKHRQEWLRTQAPADLSRWELSDTLLSAIAKEMRTKANAVAEHSRKQLASTELELQAAVENLGELQSNLIEANSKVESLQKQLTQSQTSNAELKKQHETLQQAITEERNKQEALRDELSKQKATAKAETDRRKAVENQNKKLMELLSKLQPKSSLFKAKPKS